MLVRRKWMIVTLLFTAPIPAAAGNVIRTPKLGNVGFKLLKSIKTRGDAIREIGTRAASRTIAIVTAVTIASAATGAEAAGASTAPGLDAGVVAINISGASAISQVGMFLNASQGACGGSPIPTHFPSYITSGAVADPNRILVGSQSNFGAPPLTGVGLEGSFLSIDPSGAGILSVPPNFASGGGHASTLNGAVQMFAANSADWLNSINNPAANTAQYTGVSMAEPLLATQLTAPPQPRGNASDHHVPHGVYRCAGEDEWISLVTTTDAEWRNLCAVVPGLAPMAKLGFGARQHRRAAIDQAMAAWLRPKPPAAAEAALLRASIPAAALANSRDLVNSNHLKERGFWEPYGAGTLPGLPWHASFGRTSGPAPQLGADTRTVLREVLDLSADEIAALHKSGALVSTTA